MISNSMCQGSEEIGLYLLVPDFDSVCITIDIPELADVFLSKPTSSDYPAWEALLEGLDLPVLNNLDPAYGSLEL